MDISGITLLTLHTRCHRCIYWSPYHLSQLLTFMSRTDFPGFNPYLKRYYFINCIVMTTKFMSQFHHLCASNRSYSPVFRSDRHRCHGTTVQNQSTCGDLHTHASPRHPHHVCRRGLRNDLEDGAYNSWIKIWKTQSFLGSYGVHERTETATGRDSGVVVLARACSVLGLEKLYWWSRTNNEEWTSSDV